MVAPLVPLSGENCANVQGFLGSSTVKAALNQSASVLAAILVLKKICDHPALLNDRAAIQAVRMPRRVEKTRRVRAPKKRTDAKPSGEPRAQRPARVLDDSDSEEGEGVPRDGTGFAVRVDGVLQRKEAPAKRVGAAAACGVPEGLEDDDAGVEGGRGCLEDSCSEDGGVDALGAAGDLSEEEDDDDDDDLADFVVRDSEEEEGSSSGSESGSDGGGEDEGELSEAEDEWRADGNAEEDAQNLMKRLKNMSVGDSCKTVRPARSRGIVQHGQRWCCPDRRCMSDVCSAALEC